MNTKSFVGGSSIILAGWLGATFFNDVPSKRYPRLDNKTAAVSLSDEIKPATVEPAKSLALPVSVSR